MDLKALSGNRRARTAAAVALAILLLGGALFAYLSLPKGKEGMRYDPTTDLPSDYVLLVEEPVTVSDMQFVAMLSSLAVTEDGRYNPLFVLTPNGTLDDHQLDTITKAHLDERSFILFASDPDAPPAVTGQVQVAATYDVGGASLSRFTGFEDILTVGSFEEALWAAPIAREENKVMVQGPSTFLDQSSAWERMRSLGIPFDYVIMTNPLDYDMAMLRTSPGYNVSSDHVHIPKLSALAAEVAAYRGAYVMTEYEPSTEEIGVMDTTLNQMSIGYYMALKEAAGEFGIPSYVAIVGSASAVPQFQLPDQTSSDPANCEGDLLVSSDVMFGFLGDDPYYMDSAVGRLVNLNVQGLSNQIVRTYVYDRFDPQLSVDYSTGTRDVQWNTHGTSFSGYQITYERMQATPARFWCRDAEDEGMTYDYFGPTGIGRDILVGDGVQPSAPADMNPALEASGFVAYRGHGSEYGSIYNIPYVINRNENGVLRGEEVRGMFLPPQVSFFVACMNAKIQGGTWTKPVEDIEINKTFALNYLYGGAVVTGGATEVSFSNVGQDKTSATEEWLPGVINPKWSDDNYEWDLNDAWFAFFWDGLLDKEDSYGSVGEALRWGENRYMNNPIRERVSPFIQDVENPEWQGGLLGAHWKEAAMFVIYGDPAFVPYPNSPGENSYRPWVNGADDTGEP